jgi:hypothetical protein
MNDLTYSGNIIEAMLWFGFTIVFAIKAWAAKQCLRRLFFVLAVAFLIFAISDLIESRTGAWWRPWWLLVMKCTYVLTFTYAGLEYRSIKRAVSKRQ